MHDADFKMRRKVEGAVNAKWAIWLPGIGAILRSAGYPDPPAPYTSLLGRPLVLRGDPSAAAVAGRSGRRQDRAGGVHRPRAPPPESLPGRGRLGLSKRVLAPGHPQATRQHRHPRRHGDGPSSRRRVHDGRRSGRRRRKAGPRVQLGSFRIDVTEVSQEVFQKIMGRNPSKSAAADKPVERVSWHAAIQFCNMRSLKEGLRPCYDLKTLQCDFAADGYRLPPKRSGNTPAARARPRMVVRRRRRRRCPIRLVQANAAKATHPVGQKRPMPGASTTCTERRRMVQRLLSEGLLSRGAPGRPAPPRCKIRTGRPPARKRAPRRSFNSSEKIAAPPPVARHRQGWPTPVSATRPMGSAACGGPMRERSDEPQEKKQRSEVIP